MTRLTRAESQARTRALIVEAATRLFLRDGFQVTSLEQIGEEAGFTRGAVYSNFPSKTAMGIAVIDELYEREARTLEAALEEAGDLASWFDALAAAFSAHEESYKAATAERYARTRERWAALFTSRLGERLPMDPEALSTVALALGLGTGAQRAVDPDLAGSAWVEMLRALLMPAMAAAA